MPLFFFDMHDDGLFVSDQEGQECRDLNAAEGIACETAAELGRSTLLSGKIRKVVIEVKNELKQRVLTATVALEVVRVEPNP